MFRLFSGSAIMRALGAGSQVLMTAVITRMLGTSEAGLVFFAYALILIVSTFTRAGTELSGLREVSQAWASDQSSTLKAAERDRLIFCIFSSLSAGVILLCVSEPIAVHSLGKDALSPLIVACFAIPGFCGLGLYCELLKAVNRSWFALFMQNAAVPIVVTSCLSLVWVLHLELNSTTVVSVLAIASMCCAVIAVFSFRSTVANAMAISAAGQSSESLFVRLQRLLVDAQSVGVVATVPVIMQWAGAVMLGFLTTPSEVSGYSVAARIAVAVSVVHSAASSVVAPRMAVAHLRGDVMSLEALCVRVGRMIAAITWPFLLLLIVIAPIVLTVFGDFSDFDSTLRVLLIGQLVAAIIGHSGMTLVMSGEYGLARVNSLVSASSLTVFLALLTGPFGAVGSAAAMTIAVTIGHVTAVAMVRKRLGFWTVSLRQTRINQ